MAVKLSISSDSGNINIGGDIVLLPMQSKSEIEPRVADMVIGARKHRNGFEWLDLGGLTFGGSPAVLSLCFHDLRLVEAGWSVQLPDAVYEGGWPTRASIDAEISFVQATLINVMGLPTGRAKWGDIWSSFDPKGFLASNGLRYRAR